MLRGGLDFLVLLAFFPSVISSFFTQNKGVGQAPRAPPLDLSLGYELAGPRQLRFSSTLNAFVFLPLMQGTLQTPLVREDD